MIRMRTVCKQGVFITYVLFQYHNLQIYGSKTAGIYQKSEIDPHHPPCFLTCIIIPPAWLCIGGSSAYLTALDSKLTPEIPVGVMMRRGPVNGPLSPLAEGGRGTALGKWPICN